MAAGKAQFEPIIYHQTALAFVSIIFRAIVAWTHQGSLGGQWGW
jgi:hypothetical protein